MFCLLLWVWAGAGGEFMRKPVGKWSNEDVIEWVGGLGEWTQHNYSDIFRKEVRKQKEGQIVSLSYNFISSLSLLLFPPSSLPPPHLPLLPLPSSCPFFSLTHPLLLLSSPLPFCHLSPFSSPSSVLLPYSFLLFATNRKLQVLVCYC